MACTVCVTGAAGFIGSHVVDRLLELGHKVYAIDDMSSGNPKNLSSSNIIFEDVDVRDSFAMSRILKNCDWLVHAAAKVCVEESFQMEIEYRDVNYWGTRSVMSAAAGVGIERAVYLSTCGVYGKPRRLPIKEAHPTDPQSPYALTKLEGEAAVLSTKDLSYAILRLANVYGPRQDTKSAVVGRFCLAEALGIPCTIHGDGSQSRDMIYVQDVVDAVICALTSKRNGVFNIGSSSSVSIMEIYKTLRQVSPCDSEDIGYIRGTKRPADVQDVYLNVSRAARVLRWVPTTRLYSGIRYTLDYYLSIGGVL